MSENQISKIIVDACYKLHVQLGPGLLESVYETILYYELTKQGLTVERRTIYHFKKHLSHQMNILRIGQNQKCQIHQHRQHD
jgi:GxxExxY protein